MDHYKSTHSQYQGATVPAEKPRELNEYYYIQLKGEKEGDRNEHLQTCTGAYVCVSSWGMPAPPEN